MPENSGGFVPRPSDVIAALTGGDADDIQDTTESATDGVATGTPPAVGPGGLLNSARLPTQLGGILGSFGLQNTNVGQDAVDAGNSLVGDSDGTGIDIPWMQLGLFALLLIAVNAFASGAGEGLTG
jgi:hypothetical protein